MYIFGSCHENFLRENFSQSWERRIFKKISLEIDDGNYLPGPECEQADGDGLRSVCYSREERKKKLEK